MGGNILKMHLTRLEATLPASRELRQASDPETMPYIHHPKPMISNPRPRLTPGQLTRPMRD